MQVSPISGNASRILVFSVVNFWVAALRVWRSQRLLEVRLLLLLLNIYVTQPEDCLKSVNVVSFSQSSAQGRPSCLTLSAVRTGAV